LEWAAGPPGRLLESKNTKSQQQRGRKKEGGETELTCAREAKGGRQEELQLQFKVYGKGTPPRKKGKGRGKKKGVFQTSKTFLKTTNKQVSDRRKGLVPTQGSSKGGEELAKKKKGITGPEEPSEREHAS